MLPQKHLENVPTPCSKKAVLLPQTQLHQWSAALQSPLRIGQSGKLSPV